MLFLISIALFVYGTIIGSFLNVIILRTPKNEGVVKGRSRCMTCEHTLAWYDLFPVLSWVTLRGKCRYCKTEISGRYALVESICGVSYVVAFFAAQDMELYPLLIGLLLALVLFPILICLSFLDIDTGEIDYWCTGSIALLGVFVLFLSIFGVIGTHWSEHIIGLFAISVPFAILLFLGAMGGGDVQLMAAAGLILGWSIIPAALIGVILGAIVGIIYKIKFKPQKQKMVDDEDDDFAIEGTPLRFGPFLAIGIAVGFLYGEQIINWYMSSFMS